MKYRPVAAQLNAGSMADIAFLMLIFFMVTTVMVDEKGLSLLLPPYLERPITKHVADRNLFKVQINSRDQLLIDETPRASLDGVRAEIKQFILNHGKVATLSDSPSEAIVSLKADRGTSHGIFIKVLDEVQAAYYEIYAERAGMPVDKYRELDLNKRNDRLLYEIGRKDIPMNISIAEPTRVGNEGYK